MFLISDNLSIYIFCCFTLIFSGLIAFCCGKIFSKYRTNKKVNENSSDDLSNLHNLQNESFEKSINFRKIREQIEQTLSEDQLAEEKRVENAQLAAIQELLKKQANQLRTDEFDEEQIREQLSLYR